MPGFLYPTARDPSTVRVIEWHLVGQFVGNREVHEGALRLKDTKIKFLPTQLHEKALKPEAGKCRSELARDGSGVEPWAGLVFNHVYERSEWPYNSSPIKLD